MIFKRERKAENVQIEDKKSELNDLSGFFYWQSPGLVGKIHHAVSIRHTPLNIECTIDFDPPGKVLDPSNGEDFELEVQQQLTSTTNLISVDIRDDGATSIRANCTINYLSNETIDRNESSENAIWIGVRRNETKLAIPYYRGIFLPKDQSLIQNNPNDDLQKRTMGWFDGEKFELKGFSDAHLLSKIFQDYCGKEGTPNTILDFGAGAGRVLKYLPLAFQNTENFVGTEIDNKQVIDFCENNTDSRISLILTDIKPPIKQLKNESVEFAYALSVFTHMRLEDEEFWLQEANRLLKTGAIFVVSIMSLGTLGWAKWTGSSFPPEFQLNLLIQGRDSSGLNLDIQDSIEDSEYYRNTYHTANYVIDHWLKYFDILDILPYAFGYQDAVILRKR
jgi:SAM-dependent methyltransferase